VRGAILLLVAACCAALWGCERAPTDPSLAVDALFLDGRTGAAPGAAVIVIRDGKILKKAGYGMADLERRVPIESDTAFRLASVSKQFTAMAIMLLEEEGRLGYDDPVTRFLPELSRFGDDLSIRHLLTHTGGLPDYYDVMVQVSGVARPLTKHALDVFSEWGEPLFAPGERYEYSNPGYELLALIAERASGRKFPAFVAERIFAPLGMTHSVVMDEPSPHIAKRALGYRENGDAFELYDDDPLKTTRSITSSDPAASTRRWKICIAGTRRCTRSSSCARRRWRRPSAPSGTTAARNTRTASVGGSVITWGGGASRTPAAGWDSRRSSLATWTMGSAWSFSPISRMRTQRVWRIPLRASTSQETRKRGRFRKRVRRMQVVESDSSGDWRSKPGARVFRSARLVRLAALAACALPAAALSDSCGTRCSTGKICRILRPTLTR
jgi:CubicO group peptidase (beta-lactamase class C family)